MIHVTRTAEEVTVSVTTTRRPLMYLDQCALYEFSKQNQLGHRFRQIFKRRGELLLSSINLFELGQLQGDSLERAKSFLDDVIGSAWIPIEYDPTIVVEREMAGRFSPSPAICESLLELTCAPVGVVSISKLLERVRHSPSERAIWDGAKAEFGRQIEAARKDYLARPDRKIPDVPRTPQTRTLSVVNVVFRLVLESSRGARHFLWSANDAEDFTHAITGLAHAEVVVLDGKWADRVRGLAPAKVFSCGELSEFLDWCEAKSANP